MGKLLWVVLLCVVSLCGCSWDGTPTRSNDITPLTSITITADYSRIAAGTSMPFKAIGHYSGEFTRDISDRVTWSSDALGVAAFKVGAYPSRISGVAAGTARVTATVSTASGTMSSSTTVTVTTATISSLKISPTSPSVAQGLATSFTAVGNFSDATQQDMTFDASWTSGTPAVATIGATPATTVPVSSKTLGTTQITATFSGVSDSTILTVTAPVLQSITVTSATGATSLPTMSKLGFTAKGTYSDGALVDVSSKVTWSSDNTAYATVDTTGMVTTLSPGTATIIATSGNITGRMALKATGGTLTGFSLTPATVTRVINAGTLVTATGSFNNGTSRDISRVLSWSPADASFVNVSTSNVNSAWLRPLKVNSTSGTIITATAPTASGTAKTATTTVTVTDPTLSSVTLSSGTLGIIAGTGGRLSLTANFNGSSQDVTAVATWSSDQTSKITVENGVVNGGRVTGVAAGSAIVTASYGGKSATSTVTVTAPLLQSLTISGSNSFTAGNQFSFTATALYGDGSQVNVTDLTSWSMDKVNVAVIAGIASQPGRFVAVDSGSTIITATFNEKSDTKTITVSGN